MGGRRTRETRPSGHVPRVFEEKSEQTRKIHPYGHVFRALQDEGGPDMKNTPKWACFSRFLCSGRRGQGGDAEHSIVISKIK